MVVVGDEHREEAAEMALFVTREVDGPVGGGGGGIRVVAERERGDP